MNIKFSCAIAIAIFTSLSAIGQTSSAFTYQGLLKNSGTPVTGSVPMTFKLFDAATGGTQVGTTISLTANVTSGLFVATLDFGDSAFKSNPKWIEIECNALTLGPRQPVTAAPLSTYSASTNGLDVDSSGNVTIPGMLTVSALMAPPGGCAFAATNTSGVLNSAGLCGQDTSITGTTYGVIGKSFSDNGRGVCGAAMSTSTTGATFGGYFTAASQTGTGAYGASNVGLYGKSTSANGDGVYGYASGGPNAWGVAGETVTGQAVIGRAGTSPPGGGFPTGTGVVGYSNTNAGIGVYGWNSNGNNSFDTFGGYFVTTNNSSGIGVSGKGDKTGVLGNTTAGGISIYGVGAGPTGWAGYFTGRGYFQDSVGFGNISHTYPVDAAGNGLYTIQATNSNISNGAAAIYGYATATTGIQAGVYGNTFNDSARGVQGTARSTSSTASSIGVYGFSASGSTNSFALFGTGNFGVTGTKAFRIDHPLDPENKYLLHYCAESPEPQNFYNGNSTLDANGEAWVKLPDYFSEINKDFRYTLTAVEAAMPNLHVGKKIVGNKFMISGGAPNGEVSWEVKALRNDRWVQRNGAPSEINKPDSEKGKYQRPELYDQPMSKGNDFVAPVETVKVKK